MTHPLAIVVFTCCGGERAKYAERTIQSVLASLRYSGPVFLHIADDGSPDGVVDALAAMARKEAEGRFYDLVEITSTNTGGGRGYGASYNLATQVVHARADLVLALEDDWECRGDLDLDPLAAAIMEEDSPINCVRLGYLGWTDELRGKIVKAANQTFLLFDWLSPERHVFAGHPRLESVAYERRIGEWPEGIDAGTTEFIIAGRTEARTGVAWPLDMRIMASQSHGSMFAHIGAVQARTDQHA